MRTILPILALFSMLSCAKNKDWNCRCEYSSTFYGSGTQTKQISQKNKSEATSECSDYGKSPTGGNGTYKCEIAPK